MRKNTKGMYLFLGLVLAALSGAFGQSVAGGRDLYHFLAAIEEADRIYLYEHRRGEPGFDSHGNPLYREMSGLYGPEGDLSGWENMVTGKMEEILEGESEELSAEFNRIYVQRKRAFLNQRLKDLYSLRGESESMTADALLKRQLERISLVDEDLLSGLSDESLLFMDSPSPGGEGKEIEEMLEDELAEWKKRKEEFFQGRSAWERDALNVYFSEKDRWREGISALEEKRAEWREKVEILINEEDRRWQDAYDAYYSGFNEHAEELRREKDRAEELFRQNLERIEERYNGAVERSSFASDIIENLRPLMDREGVEEEADFWKKVKESAEGEAETAERELITYITDNGGFSGRNEPLDSELNYLKLRKRILEREIEIVSAVVDYSADDTSNRAREAETEKRFLRARDEYDRLYGEYIGALRNLNSKKSDFDLLLDNRNKLLEDMGHVRREISRMRVSYDEKLSLLREEQMNGLYAEYSYLIEETEKEAALHFSDTKREERLRKFFASEEDSKRKELLSRGEELLNTTLFGDGAAPSLSELREETEIALEAGGADPFVRSLEELLTLFTLSGIELSEEQLLGLSEVYRERFEPGEEERVLTLEHRARGLINRIISAKRLELERRNILADLLSRESDSGSLNPEAEFALLQEEAVRKGEDLLKRRLELEYKALTVLLDPSGAETADRESMLLAEIAREAEIFSEDEAEEAMHSVISGLERLEEDGYFHRDGVFLLDGIDPLEYLLREEILEHTILLEKQKIITEYGQYSKRFNPMARKNAGRVLKDELGILFDENASGSGKVESYLRLTGASAAPDYISFFTDIYIQSLPDSTLAAMEDAAEKKLDSLEESSTNFPGSAIPERVLLERLIEAAGNPVPLDRDVLRKEYQDMLRKSIDSMLETPEESAGIGDGPDLLSRERDIVMKIRNLKIMKDERDILSSDENRYRKEVLAPLAASIEEKKSEFNLIQTEVDKIESGYKDLSDAIGELEILLKEKREGYESAELEYRTAEEILSFASRGYVLEGLTPVDQLLKLKEQKERTEAAEDFLGTISERGGEEFLRRGDPEYLRLAREADEHKERFVWFKETLGMTEKRVEENKNRMELQREKGLQAADELFSVTIEPEQWESIIEGRSFPLTDYTDYDMETLGNLVLTEQEILHIGTAWISSLIEKGHSSEVLRKYGEAFFYETRNNSGYRFDLDRDASLNTLLDKVGIDAEELLEEETRGSYNAVSSEKGYGVFKLLLAKKAAEEQLAEEFTREDLKGVLSLRGRADAGRLVRSKRTAGAINASIAGGLWVVSIFAPWFIPQAVLHSGLAVSFFKEAERLDALKRSVKEYSGAETRKELVQRGVQFLGAAEEYEDAGEELAVIIGKPGASLDSEGLAASLETVLREALPEEISSFVDSAPAEIFNVSTYPEVLAGALERTSLDYNAQRELISQRASYLMVERESVYEEYRRYLETGEGGKTGFSRLVTILFERPAFSRQDYWKDRWDRENNGNSPGDFASSVEIGMGELERVFERRILESSWEFDLERELLENRRTLRLKRTNMLIQEGERAWQRAIGEIEVNYEKWASRREREIEEGIKLWNGKYRTFAKGIEVWGRNIKEQIRGETLDVFVKDLGMERRAVEDQLSHCLVPEIVPEGLDVSGRIRSTVPEDRTEDIIRALSRISGSLGKERFIGSSIHGVRELLFTGEKRTEFEETLHEIGKRAAGVHSFYYRNMIEDARKRIRDGIRDINRNTEESIDLRLLDSGYNRNGGSYVRESIIDDTLLGGVEFETHKISEYRYYKPPELDIGVDLDSKSILRLPPNLVYARSRLAVNRLERYGRLIFGGSGDGNGKNMFHELNEAFVSAYEKERLGYYRRSGGEGDSSRGGLMEFHIGYAPEMDPEDPESILKEGYGEYGRIFAEYFKNEARLSRGLFHLDQAFYNIRLWDDDYNNDGESDGFIKAPSLRDVVDIAVGIFANVLVPGGGFLVNMVDDAGFTLMDIGRGDTTVGEGLLGLGKQALSGLLQGAGIGSASTEMFSGVGKIGADAVTSAFKAGINHLGQSAINAFSLEGGTLVFQEDTFSTNLLSTRGAGKIASSFTSGFISSSLGEMNSRERSLSGLSSSHRNSVGELNSLAGGLTGAAVEYGITGETSLNMLNFRDIARIARLDWYRRGGGEGWYSNGLLEWKIGDNQFLSLGGGGTDVSVSRSVESIRGVKTWADNTRIARFVDNFGRDISKGMRYLYSFGDSSGVELFNDIVSGNTVLAEAVNDDPGFLGESRIDEEFNKQILLNPRLLGDNESQLLLGVLLQHEAYRDGSVTRRNEEETLSAVMGRTEMALRVAGDSRYGAASLLSYPGLFLDAAVYAGDRNFFTEFSRTLYSSEGDFWKLMDNNTIVWDGSKDLRSEDNYLLREDRTNSFSQSLYTYLGDQGAKEILEGMGIRTRGRSVEDLAYDLMVGSGAFWDEGKGEYVMMTAAALDSEYNPAGGYGGGKLSENLGFTVSGEHALNLGKLPQYSPDAAWTDASGDNIMARYGCFLMSVLGAVQTNAGKNLTPEQVRTVVDQSFKKGYLKDDMYTLDKSGISRLAFEELGEFKEIYFTPNGEEGTLLVGATGPGTVHAREGNPAGEELFDPYPWVSYLRGGEFKEVRPYEIREYTPSWEEFKSVRLR